MCYFLMSQTFIVDEEGTRPCIIAVLQDHVLLKKFLTIFPLPVHEIVFEIVSNCFSRNRWIVPTNTSPSSRTVPAKLPGQ